MMWGILGGLIGAGFFEWAMVQVERWRQERYNEATRKERQG